MIYVIDMNYAYFGIETKNGKCIKAPPIAKWMIGKPIAKIFSWVLKKNGKIVDAHYININ